MYPSIMFMSLLVLTCMDGRASGLGRGINQIGSSKTGCMRDASPACGDISAADCYVSGVRGRCCKTCASFQRSFDLDEGCEYGDRDPDECRMVRARHCTGHYAQFVCCGTCAAFIG